MHQEHTIPWNSLASHFVFIRDNPHRTPRKTDIFPIDPPRPTRKGDLTHFARVLAETIRSFARTEREKHPSAEDLRLEITGTSTRDGSVDRTNLGPTGSDHDDGKETSTDSSSSPPSSPIVPPKLFPDALLTRYPQYLTEKMQHPMYWAARAQRNIYNRKPSLSTADGDFADAIKVLIYVTDARSILCLAHFPFEVKAPNQSTAGRSGPDVVSESSPGPATPIPLGPVLGMLSRLSWGHSFGVDRIVDAALWVYIYFNLSSSLDLIASGTFMETYNFSTMFRDTTQEMDYCAQQLPHRAFWQHMGICDADGRICADQVSQVCATGYHMYTLKARQWTGADLEWVKRYMKEVFRLMYVYDMVMRECGVEVNWEDEIVWTLGNTTKTKISTSEGVVKFA